MAVERIEGGEYQQYYFSIAEYDIHLAAIRTLEWYIAELNKCMDTKRYQYMLTHRECMLLVRIYQGDLPQKDLILARANAEISRSRQMILLLAEGVVPEELKSKICKKYGHIKNEW